MNCIACALAGGAAFVVLVAGASGQGQCSPREVAHLRAFDGAARDVFGLRVAIDGDTAIVGAVGHDTEPGPIGGQGAAYVFTRTGGVWSQQAKLTASDGEPLDQFGVSVAIDGDTAVVGAYTPGGSDPGSAYVFTRGGGDWTEVAKLAASDGVPFDYFGISVAIQGDTILVGAPRADTSGGIDAGAVYVFVHNGRRWNQRAKLSASDGDVEDRFGNAVALAGNTALVGSYLDNDPGGGPIVQNAGSAYVFVLDGGGWTQQAILTASSPGFRAQFGQSIAIQGDTVVVGEPYRNTQVGLEVGAAYVFVLRGGVWTQQTSLTASDGAAEDHFGTYVAYDEETALIGASWHDAGAGARSGAAYAYGRGGAVWTEQTKLIASDGAPGDEFGVCVALDGDTAVVGATFDDTAAGTDAGSAYVFDPLCGRASYVTFGQGCPGSAGVPALHPRNLPVLGTTFQLDLLNLPAGGIGMMVIGFSDTVWNGVPLPFGLSSLGLPGCSVFVSVDAVEILPVVGNLAMWSIALPNSPALAGARFFNQGVSIENGTLAAVSDGGAGTIH